MNIGIACDLNVSAFESYFEEEKDKRTLRDESLESMASAVYTLVMAYLEKEHHITLFCLAKSSFTLSSRKIKIVGISGVNGYPVRFLWGEFINAGRIKAAMDKNIADLDVLHVHWTRSYALAATNFTNELPVLCTVRDWVPYIWKIESPKNKITWSFLYVLNEMVLRSKKVYFIANSNYTASMLEKKLGYKVTIIPNPIKKEFLLEKERVVPKGLKLLCISTSIDKRKNVTTLLLAFKELRKQYPDAELALVGHNFSLTNPKVKKWQDMNLLLGVQLVGSLNHDDLPKQIDQATIYVTPSLEETFGNTLLEAMARNVPVVAGENSGAIPYVLEHGKAGFLCNVSKVDELLDALKFVHENPQKAKEKTDFAKTVLFQKYLDEKVVENNITYYQEVISQHQNKA